VNSLGAGLIGFAVGIAFCTAVGVPFGVWFHFTVCHRYLERRRP
jgi:hypothetical protein